MQYCVSLAYIIMAVFAGEPGFSDSLWFLCHAMPSDSDGKGVMFAGCPIHLFVHLDIFLP